MLLMKRALTTLTTLMGLAAVAAQAQGPVTLDLQDPIPRTEVSATCGACHPTGALDRALQSVHALETSCLACHHVGFTNDPAEASRLRREGCITCHEDVSPAHHREAGSPDCVSCHTLHPEPGAGSQAQVVSPACGSCHQDVHPTHAGVVDDAPACAQCHSTHQAPAGDAGSAPRPAWESPWTSPEAMTAQCLGCHEDVLGPHPRPVDGGPTCALCHSPHEADGSAFMIPALPGDRRDGAGAKVDEACSTCHTDVHPSHQGITEGAPTCTQCHDFHGDRGVASSGLAMSTRCGQCHAQELAEHGSGGHREGLVSQGGGAPDCLSCHDSHVDPAKDLAETRFRATLSCIQCHSDDMIVEAYGLPELAARSYEKDFHGQTLRFLFDHPNGKNQPDIMVCSDCHGAHQVSWVGAEEVSEVCVSCHEKANVSLAGAWLGHGKVGPRNASLVWLARVFYFVFIPLVLGGLIVNILFHLKDQRRKGARVARTEGVQKLGRRLRGEPLPKEHTVTRFRLVERIEHLGSMTTFILLVVTGLPQVYSRSEFATGIIRFFGGIQMTRYIHRTVGVIFVLLMAAHLVRAILGSLKKRQLPAMVPDKQDFLDTWQTIKHYVWRAPKPKVGKFDFGQKYEYWGLLLGGTVMSSTGLLLLFPELFSQVLPGLFLALAKVVHGLEGTFAVLVVVVWHTYGVILRPEIFPLDTTIFTGKMSVERLKDEHALEYERIFGVTLPDEEGTPPGTLPAVDQDTVVAAD